MAPPKARSDGGGVALDARRAEAAERTLELHAACEEERRLAERRPRTRFASADWGLGLGSSQTRWSAGAVTVSADSRVAEARGENA